jgi:hypothetical protein
VIHAVQEFLLHTGTELSCLYVKTTVHISSPFCGGVFNKKFKSATKALLRLERKEDVLKNSNKVRKGYAL